MILRAIHADGEPVDPSPTTTPRNDHLAELIPHTSRTDAIPSVFADCDSLLRRMPPDKREAATQLGAPPYRTALLFIAFASVPFAFLGRPLLIVIAFTVLGRLFIPSSPPRCCI